MEKWKDKNFFCLIEKKNKGMETVICINLLFFSCIKHYSIIFYIILLINIYFFTYSNYYHNIFGGYFWVGLVLNVYKRKKKNLDSVLTQKEIK